MNKKKKAKAKKNKVKVSRMSNYDPALKGKHKKPLFAKGLQKVYKPLTKETVKLSDKELIKQLDRVSAGEITKTDIAGILGISRTTLYKKIKKLNYQKTKALTKEAKGAVRKGLNAVDQLKTINESAIDMLSKLESELKELDEVEKFADINGLSTEEIILRVKAFLGEKDSKRHLLLQNLKEIREQVKTQLEIMKSLYDLKAIEEFQQEVINVINEVEPTAAARIVKALAQKSVI